MDDHPHQAEAIACLKRALELIDKEAFGSTAAPHIDYGLYLLSAEAETAASREPVGATAL